MKKFRYTKVAILIVILTFCICLLASCGNPHKTGNRITGGKDVQTFTYCYIVLGGKEVVKGAVTQWRDYDNSDTVQVLVDGKYYLTHYTNVVLVADPNQGALSYSDVSVGWDSINE
jgi:hypothetical protein